MARQRKKPDEQPDVVEVTAAKVTKCPECGTEYLGPVCTNPNCTLAQKAVTEAATKKPRKATTQASRGTGTRERRNFSSSGRMD